MFDILIIGTADQNQHAASIERSEKSENSQVWKNVEKHPIPTSVLLNAPNLQLEDESCLATKTSLDILIKNKTKNVFSFSMLRSNEGIARCNVVQKQDIKMYESILPFTKYS